MNCIQELYQNINTIVLPYIHTRMYKFQCWQLYIILDKMLQFLKQINQKGTYIHYQRLIRYFLPAKKKVFSKNSNYRKKVVLLFFFKLQRNSCYGNVIQNAFATKCASTYRIQVIEVRLYLDANLRKSFFIFGN